MSYFARIIINKVDGSASAGIFSLADDVGAIMMVVSMSFNKSWTPIFYQKMNDNDVIGIRKQSARIIKYTALIAVFLIFSLVKSYFWLLMIDIWLLWLSSHL